MISSLSKRAPAIVILTLCAALLCQWVDAPAWLPKSVAIIVAGLAVALMGTRSRQFTGGEGHGGSKGWLAYELAGKGTPPGSYLLGFFAFLTIVLTGFQSAYSAPAWAAFALGIVWGIVNSRYPDDDDE